MAYFRSQILPSKLTYKTVAQDVQISSDSAYVPVTFGTIQGLKYVTVKLKQDRGGGTVYEGSATIPVSKISGSSAKVAQIYLNNNFTDAPFKIDLSMSYTGANVDYSGTYYNMYITILGFPMDIFAPVSLVRTPFIMPSGAQKIILPLTSLQWDKLETKMYADGTKTSPSKEFNIIGGNTWRAQTRSLCSRVNVGSWRLTYQFGNQYIDNVWFGNFNNKTTDILLENNSYTLDGVQYTGNVPTSMIEDNTVIFADDTHYDDGVALGRTKIYNSDVLVMDLVPVNRKEGYITLPKRRWAGDSTPTSQNPWPFVRSLSQFFDTIQFKATFVPLNGSDPIEAYIDTTGNIFTDGAVHNFSCTQLPSGVRWVVLNANTNGLISLDMATTFSTSNMYITVSGTLKNKEGCFYDTIGDKYYFSETATPLVYTEL